MLSIQRFIKRVFIKASLLLALLFAANTVWAEGPPPPSSMSNPFVVTLAFIAILLAIAIGVLANVVLGSASIYAEKEKKKNEEKNNGSGTNITTIAGVIILLLSTTTLYAQDSASPVTRPASLMDGISPVTFYMLTGVIFLELIVVIALLYNLRLLLDIQRKKKAIALADAKPAVSWWDKANSFKPMEQEVDILLDHDYDGIRELDNRLPPWWLYGFYCCILFAIVYLWRYHVSESAPLSKEEYEISMREAAVEQEAYLLKAANKVDETNVKQLTDPSDIEAGKRVFQSICFSCHGKAGEGGQVAPNLTDDYWLHGGNIKDVFKTIKYGWPEKGMKSWKDDYSPLQIEQIASYVKSLHGTNPPNAKAPQGVLYIDSTATAPKKDSVIKAVK